MAARCVTCKHWSKGSPRYTDSDHWGMCDSPIWNGYNDFSEDESVGVRYGGGDGYGEGFEVTHNFGCVGHELE